MVKLLGLLMAFAACKTIGFYKASEIKRRRILLVDFKELLIHISTEMSYFKEPLPQIFERLAGEASDNKERTILLRECLSTYSLENMNIAEIWKTAVEHIYNDSSLTREDISIMKKCGDFLGQSDFSRQQEHFSLLNMQLDRQVEEAEESIKTKGRMYGKMGISVGLVVAIVFI